MSLATVAAVVGTAAGGMSLINQFRGGSGGGGTGGGGQSYVPQGSGGADTAWQQILQQLQGGAGGAANAINPNIASAYQAMSQIPTSGLTQAGQQAGQYYGNLASNQDAMHNLLANQGNQAGAAGQQLWQTALDPQNQLRNMLQQQVTDASRAGTSARGIGMSGNAAGLENQDVSNFLMNWQDRQLGRQSTGLQGMLSGYNQAGQDYTGASNLATAAGGNILQSGQVPYGANTMAAGAPFGYANQYNQAQGGTNQNLSAIMAQIIPYLYAGQGATGQNFAQGQTGLNNFTSGLTQLGKSPFLQNVFGNMQSGSPQNSQSTFGTNQNIYNPPTFDQPYGP